MNKIKESLQPNSNISIDNIKINSVSFTFSKKTYCGGLKQ